MQPVRYRVTVTNPHTHRIGVELSVADPGKGPARVTLPSWSPGSYLLREFARQIDRAEAVDESGEKLPCTKVAKGTWEVRNNGAGFSFRYGINAQELSVRTPWLDRHWGFFVGTNVFAYLEGGQDRPCKVEFELPGDWTVWSSRNPGFRGDSFECTNYDLLADSAVGLAPAASPLHEFEVLGKPHAFVTFGAGEFDASEVLEGAAAMIREAAAMFGGELPYERYLFLNLMTADTRGGLEHLDSSALAYPRTKFGQKEYHQDFMMLVIHEFFHVWNIKRIHSDALSPFDYTAENYTRDLWVGEGWTSYYQSILALRAGVISRDDFLKYWGKRLTYYQKQPGRLIQPVDEASYDAWIKLYRRDGNSPNTTISYYLKGSIIAMLLDVEIRKRTENQKSLDDVFLYLWKEFGQHGVGYPEGTMQQQVEQVVGGDFTDFFNRHVRSAEPVDFDILQYVGLVLGEKRSDDADESGSEADDGAPELGIRFARDSLVCQTVYADGPAQKAGLMYGDELVAIDGYRIDGGKLERVLKTRAPGDEIQITFFHQDRLETSTLTLAQPVRDVELKVAEKLSEKQRRSLDSWLGSVESQ